MTKQTFKSIIFLLCGHIWSFSFVLAASVVDQRISSEMLHFAEADEVKFIMENNIKIDLNENAKVPFR